MDKEIKFGYVFDETEKAFSAGEEIIIHQGGTGSGKTYDLMLFIIFLATSFEKKIITVVSESYPHLEIGTIRYTHDIINQFNLSDLVKVDKSKNQFTFPNKTILEFFSADRIEKALGARRWLLYGNEINSLKFEVWDELARRSKIIIGDFNPTAEFWLEKFLAFYGKHKIIKSNYLNNPFLPIQEKNRIEQRAKIDPNFKRTHVDVEYGTFEGLVFPDWAVIDQFPSDCKWVSFGMDYGFSNDPSTLIKVGMKDDSLFLDELMYSTGMLASDIGRHLASIGLSWADDIISDNKPEAIFEIQKMGFNIKPAYKPAGSIVAGIEIIKEYKIFVTSKSLNLIKELRNYKWKTDKSNTITNEPIDFFNHCIDAVRYAVMSRRFNKSRTIKISRA